MQDWTQKAIDSEDPVDVLAERVREWVFGDEDMEEACHALVLRDMGLHPDTRLGGDANDRRQFMLQWIDENTDASTTMADLCGMPMPDYLIDTDPRFDLYWERIATLHDQILAQAIAANKFRWASGFRQSTKNQEPK